jgi:hypothetical protein
VEEPIPREQVKELMLEDYEKVVFYLLTKLALDLDEINVVMMQGEDRYEFKMKRPVQSSIPGEAISHIHKIEYISQI